VISLNRELPGGGRQPFLGQEFNGQVGGHRKVICGIRESDWNSLQNIRPVQLSPLPAGAVGGRSIYPDIFHKITIFLLNFVQVPAPVHNAVGLTGTDLFWS